MSKPLPGFWRADDLDGAWALASDVTENLLFEPASSNKVRRRVRSGSRLPLCRGPVKRQSLTVLVVFEPFGVC